MAMRGKGGSRGNTASRPPRLIVNRVFEQFKPMSEWRQEDGYDTLLVYLPGFQKENIKVTTEGVNIVRVRGERLVSENKWSRFQEDYRLPESCEMSGISARFDGGILTITMPRKITNAPPPPPPTTMARVAPKREQPQNPKEEPKEKKPDKPQTTRLEDETLPPQPKPTSSSAPTKQSSKPQTTGSEDSTWPAPPKPSSSAPTKQPSKPQASYTLPPQPKPTSSSAPTKQQPLKPQTTGSEDSTWPTLPKPSSSAPTKQPSKPQTSYTLPPQPKPTSSSAPNKQPPNTRFEDKTLPPQPKPASSSAPTKQQPSNIRLEDKTFPPQPKSTSSSTPTKQQPSGPVPEAKESRGGFKQEVAEKPDVRKKMDLDKAKGKEAILEEETKRDFEGSKGKPNNSGVISGGLQGILARGGLVNEDRKLLVNVGVGVLMIAALAVHVSYTIGLIGKEK